jgi:hypothetical protein
VATQEQHQSLVLEMRERQNVHDYSEPHNRFPNLRTKYQALQQHNIVMWLTRRNQIVSIYLDLQPDVSLPHIVLSGYYKRKVTTGAYKKHKAHHH